MTLRAQPVVRVSNPTREQTAALNRVRDAERAYARAVTGRVTAWYTARGAGWSDAQIAEAVGLSRSTVTRRLGPRR